MNRPVEIHQVQLKPVDFFTANPSIDVPGSKNIASQEVGRGNCCPGSHMNGNAINGHNVNGSKILHGAVNEQEKSTV